MKQTITLTISNDLERPRRGIEWKAELSYKGGSISETGKASDEKKALDAANLAAQSIIEELKNGR